MCRGVSAGTRMMPQTMARKALRWAATLSISPAKRSCRSRVVRRLLMGAHAHFIWPTHHLNYYTPTTIRDLMCRHALTPELIVTEGLDIEDYIWYRREVLHRDTEALTEIADVVQFLANAGCYGKNLRVIARRAA